MAVKIILPRITVSTFNQFNREEWLENTLNDISVGSRLLDAGAGEQIYKRFYKHLDPDWNRHVHALIRSAGHSFFPDEVLRS